MKLLNLSIAAVGAVFILATPFGACAAQARTSTPQSQTAPTSPPVATMKAPRPNREIKRLTNKLTLSADQQAKLRPIIEAQDKLIDQVQVDTTLSDAQKKQEIASIRQSSRTQIEPLLTDTQKHLYAEMKGGGKASQSGADSQ